MGLRVTVVTTDGKEHVHNYPISSPLYRGLDIFEAVMAPINDSMAATLSGVLPLSFPAVTYNKAFITRIAFDSPDEEAEKVAQKTMGFLRNEVNKTPE